MHPRSLVLLLAVLVTPALAAGNTPFAKALAAARATDNLGDYCSDDARDPTSVVCRAIRNDVPRPRPHGRSPRPPEPLQEMAGRIDAVNAAIDARTALLAPTRSVVAAAGSRIAAPRIVPFTERPLPNRSGAPSGTAVIDCSDAAKVAATTNLPSYVHPLRMERNGNEVVAVAISSAVDPAGEVALGGYWVLRSRDAGHTWSEYYTGLRQNLPYVVPPRRGSR